MYNIKRATTFLAKNVGSYLFGEQKNLTKFSTIFVIHVLDVVANERLVEVHNKRTNGHDFVMNFEVCKIIFFLFLVLLFSFWFTNFFYEVSTLVVPMFFM
jgi:hypothetical protein